MEIEWESFAAGALFQVEGRRGQVLINREVVDGWLTGRGKVWVSTPDGVRVMRGRVRRSPRVELVARQLVLTGAAADLTAEQTMRAAEEHDLAVIEIEDDLLLGMQTEPLRVAPAERGSLFAVLAFTGRGRMPTVGAAMELADPSSIARAELSTRTYRSLDVLLVGNHQLPTETMGGPIVAVGGHTGPDTINGFVQSRVHGEVSSRDPAPVVGALTGPAVEAVLRAAGLRATPPPTLDEAIIGLLGLQPVRAATVATLARRLEVSQDAVVRAAEDAERLLLVDLHPGWPDGERLVVFAPWGGGTRTQVGPTATVSLVDTASGQRYPVQGSTAILPPTTAPGTTAPGTTATGTTRPNAPPRRSWWGVRKRAVDDPAPVPPVPAALVRHEDGWRVVQVDPQAVIRVEGIGVEGAGVGGIGVGGEKAGRITPVRPGDDIVLDERRLRLEAVPGDVAPVEGGGLVAIGDQARARQVMLDAAETLFVAGVAVQPERYQHLPRGPPDVSVVVVPARYRPAGAEGVVAFGYSPRRVVLVFDDTLAEIDAHIGAARLSAQWWVQLLGHERDFHLLRAEHTGHRHDGHAVVFVGKLLQARASASGFSGMVRPTNSDPGGAIGQHETHGRDLVVSRAIVAGPPQADPPVMMVAVGEGAGPTGAKVSGGAALLSGGLISERDATVVAHLVAEIRNTPELPADDADLPRLTRGLGAAEFAAHRARGVRVVDRLTADVAARGGPPDLVAWAGADGWIYLDFLFYAELLVAEADGGIDDATVRQLFEHELTHIQHPHSSERDVADMAPAPDLGRLAAKLGIGSRSRVGFRRFQPAPGRSGWQAGELGPEAHPLSDRVEQLRVRWYDPAERRDREWGATGTVFSSDELGVRYTLAPPELARLVREHPGAGLTVTAFAPDLVVDMVGWAVALPSLDAVRDQLAVTGGSADGETVEEFGVTVIRTVDHRLAAPEFQFVPLDFEPLGTNEPVALLSFSDTIIPSTLFGGVLADQLVMGDQLVVTAGRHVDPPELDMIDLVKLAGDSRTGPGSAGGPVGGVGERADRDVVRALIRAIEPGVLPDGDDQIVLAVPAAVLEAVLRAIGIGRPGVAAPRLEATEYARLEALLTAELESPFVRFGSTGALAHRFGVLPDEVAVVAGRSSRLFVGPERVAVPERRLVVRAPAGVDANDLVDPGEDGVYLVRERDGLRYRLSGSSAIITRIDGGDVDLNYIEDVDVVRPVRQALVPAVLMHRWDGWHVVAVDRNDPVLVEGNPVEGTASVNDGERFLLDGNWHRVERRTG